MSQRITRARGAKTAAVANVAAVFQAETEAEYREPAVEEGGHGEDIITEQPKVTIKKPKPAFARFKTAAKLEEGLSIVRSLGGGKFEIINLESVDISLLAAEEMGHRIKSTPGLKQVMELEDKDWKEARSKVEQAMRSANGTIFRFLKLPLELRFRCYEIMIVAPGKVKHGEHWPPSKDLRLALRRSCRQVYEESAHYFWKNDFKMNTISKSFSLIQSVFTENVREITFEWWAFSKKDPVTIAIISSCTKLKVLHVLITRWTGLRRQSTKRQYLHQDDVTIKMFNKTSGFDVLARIRGLERVTVGPAKEYPPLTSGNDDITKKDMGDFEKFLMKTLTQPKPKVDENVSTLVEKNAKNAKNAKRFAKKSKGKRVKNDDEDEFEP